MIRPAVAPAAVSPRHQIPSTSNGQNDDAATANASPTASASGSRAATSDSTSGAATATTVATRNALTLPSLGRTSCAMTPATETVSPDDVDRNAAKAPAVTSAVSSSPAVPPTSRPG